MESEDYERKVDKPEDMVASVLDAAACIKRHEDQPRRSILDVLTRVAKCIEMDGGIFEHLLRTVTNLSLLCNRFVI